MHIQRQLFRPAAWPALQAVAAASAASPLCAADAVVVDLEPGAGLRVPLLHAMALRDALTRASAAAAVSSSVERHRVAAALLDAIASRVLTAAAASSPEALGDAATLPRLFARGPAPATARALREYHAKVLGRARGYSAALHGDEAAIEAVVRRLLEPKPPLLLEGEGTSESDVADAAMYRGAIEGLLGAGRGRNAAAAGGVPAAAGGLALQLASDARLPALSGSLSKAFAAAVDIERPAAVAELLRRVAAKDALVPAAHSVATHVAVRLRKELFAATTAAAAASSTKAAAEARGAALRATLDAVVRQHNVDPSVAFVSNVVAAQRWGARLMAAARTPGDRQAAVLAAAADRWLAPAHTTADALGLVCLADVERPWLAAAFAGVEARGAAGLLDFGPGGWTLPLVAKAVLRDPKRYLVDARLLRSYAAYLSAGDIAPSHPSFAAFVDEIGECYLGEPPEALTFVLPPPATAAEAAEGLRQRLRALAPASAYWTTLLAAGSAAAAPEAVRVLCPAPDGGGGVVRVALPATHEGLALDRAAAVPPVLFEDADVVVFDKPAGLPTTRHALCASQERLRRGEGDDGSPVATADVVSALLADPARGPAQRRVARAGQVHRLDADTSGVLVVAKTAAAFDSLRHQMGTSAAFGAFPKSYLALCAVVAPELARVRLSATLHDAHDARVVTRYRVVRYFAASRVALVECRLQQGKKHQIRRHLAAAGLPLLQDVHHGGAACVTPLVARVALHASSVAFVHPTTLRVIAVTARLPPDLRHALRLLAAAEAAP